MIVWINGAFGSGKTQTSTELFRRIPNSFIYDPENVKNIPKSMQKGDFQDLIIVGRNSIIQYPHGDEVYNVVAAYVCRAYVGIK